MAKLVSELIAESYNNKIYFIKNPKINTTYVLKDLL